MARRPSRFRVVREPSAKERRIGRQWVAKTRAALADSQPTPERAGGSGGTTSRLAPVLKARPRATNKESEQQ